MKEIFIGSSKEGLEQAMQVAAVLAETPGVKPVLWTECFKLGDITFTAIEDMTAMLTRNRVALCRYGGVELPSDFAGLTYVPMGPLEAGKPLDHQSKVRLKSWATDLPAVQTGFSPTCQLHGYSGTWQTEMVYETWRRIPFKDPNYAVMRGKMILQIPPDGNGGAGCFYGNMQVQSGECYAEFEISDRVVEAKVFADGSMKIRNAVQSRQRIRLEGEPAQRDGFEPDYRGAREIEITMQCPPGEAGVLRGVFVSEVAGNIYSKATGKWYR